MDSKLSITATGEKLLLGNDYFILNDETKKTFKTKSIEQFAAYIEIEKLKIFISDNLIEAFNEVDGINHNTKPVASCAIELHPVVNLLSQKNGAEMGLNEFAIFLERIKQYLTSESLKLRDNIADLKVKKILSIENQNDRRGNFNYTVKSETQGKKDYEFPRELKLIIPVILNNKSEKNSCEISFNFFFKWKMEEGNAALSFMMECFEFQKIIDEEKSRVTTEYLKNIFAVHSEKIVLGKLEIYPMTDEWKYKRNQVEISDH